MAGWVKLLKSIGMTDTQRLTLLNSVMWDAVSKNSFLSHTLAWKSFSVHDLAEMLDQYALPLTENARLFPGPPKREPGGTKRSRS